MKAHAASNVEVINSLHIKVIEADESRRLNKAAKHRASYELRLLERRTDSAVKPIK